MRTSKDCSTCKQHLSLDDFHNHASTSDGKQTRCKGCVKVCNAKMHKIGTTYLASIKIGEESDKDTAIRYAVENNWADTLSALLDNVDHDEETGCYLWRGAKDWDGYGHIAISLPTTPVSKCSTQTHRLMFAMTHGFDELPAGFFGGDATDETIDHLCGVTACINPSHLRAITKQLNSQLQRQERVAPRGYGVVIDASFADEELVALINAQSGLVK